MQKGYAIGSVYMCMCIMCLCVTKHHLFGVFQSKNSRKKAHGTFLLHFYIMNLTFDCRFTPGQVLLLFFLLVLVCPLKVVGPRGHKRCSYSCMHATPHAQYYRLRFVRLLRLNSACSAKCQQLQCCCT